MAQQGVSEAILKIPLFSNLIEEIEAANLTLQNECRLSDSGLWLYLNVDVAAGSHRFSDGRWSRACFATAMKNYTFKIVEGYDLSYNSCIFCDYASGPFVAKRDFLLENLNDTFSTDDHLRDGLEFVDFYASVYVCPDVMFTVDSRQPFFDRRITYDKSWWLPFVKKFGLNKIILQDDGRLEFSCQESETQCDSIRGLIMPICCLQELSDALKFVFDVFEKHNLTLEIEAAHSIAYSGLTRERFWVPVVQILKSISTTRTGVGGVKLYGINPYERDADVDTDIHYYAQIDALAPVFAKKGYKLAPYPQMTNETECLHKDWINCGYYLLSTINWSIEMWGVNKLGSEEAHQVGSTSRTKVFVDGRWMTSLYSPALSVRNEYGDDIFQHVEHWDTLGYESGWVQPTTGAFSKCPHVGFHACLDRYLGVGNIQFRDIILLFWCTNQSRKNI
uniref:Uncharacterized protein n=1 Tax=Romanomermis culicivorax TaxID=13658 RepID=A0A915J1G1_ROMCU